MAAAPVESCQSMVQRSPWDCLGSGLYTVSHLHRMRRRFQHILANSLNMATHLSMNYLAMASRALGGPKRRRMRRKRLPTTRPAPRGLQEPICPRKKCAIWTRWRLVPVKNDNYQYVDYASSKFGLAHCSGGFAEAVQLRRRYAVMKEAARARRR